MLELEAVNLVIRAVGGQPVSALGGGDVNSARAQENIKEQRRSVLARGWSFNTQKADFNPDVTLRVPFTTAYLKVMWPERYFSVRRFSSPGQSYDGQHYVWNHETDAWHNQTIKDVLYITDITNYPSIPFLFMEWIAWESAFQFYHQLNEDVREVPRWIGAKLIKAKSTAINSEPDLDLNVATGYASRRAAVAGGDVIINVGGEHIRG